MHRYKTLKLQCLVIFTIIINVGCTSFIRTTFLESMKCTYGERGSLTATCVNATSSYFKNTPYRFDHLDETLRCINCTLTTLETSTFDLSGNQIKFLDLRNSSIENIKTKAFVGLIFMEHLQLSNNHIKSIYPTTFIGVKKVQELELQNNEIESLNENGFLELINLKKLNLRENSISFLAKNSFNGLSELLELDLSYNKIKTFNNETWTNLTKLEVLNLQHNELTKLAGDEFFNISTLRKLDLSWNQITVPSITLNVESPGNSLLYLDLSHNSIRDLTPLMYNTLKKLENLDFSFNSIQEIPQKSLQGLHNVVNISFSYNNLTTFRTGLFSGLSQLRYLNLSHNSINKSEVTGILGMHSLHALDLSYNKLEDLDYISLVSSLPRLSYLELQDNLLPCDLEKDMDEYFMEDNFKYVLWSEGGVKCVDKEYIPKAMKNVIDTLEEQNANTGSRSAEIWIFVLISLMMLMIGGLFYLEYRTYQALKYRPSSEFATSRVNLVTSDVEVGDSDFLKE